MKSLNKFALSALVAPMLLGLAGYSGTVGDAAIGGIIGHQIDDEHTNPHG